jgi:hypothetical protein
MIVAYGACNTTQTIDRVSAVRDRLERANGVTNRGPDRLERQPLAARTRSRDFR